MMKYFYLIVLLGSKVIMSAHADELKQFCQDSVSMLILFKSKSVFEDRGRDLIRERTKTKLKKWPQRKEEIIREKNVEMETLKKVRPLGLCKDKKVLTELGDIKKYGKKWLLNCNKSRNPKATLNSLGIDDSVEPSQNLRADIKAAYMKMARTTVDILSDDNMTKACLEERVNQIKGFAKDLMSSDGNAFCKQVVYKSNHITSLPNPCEIKEKKQTFTDDQLFKCSMGEDPLKNCPSPDPEDVQAWEAKKNSLKEGAARVKKESHSKACKKGNKKACRSLNIIRYRTLRN